MENLDKELKDTEARLAGLLQQAEREQVFVDQANDRFEENILAFKQYFPDIYEKFVHFAPDEKFQLIVNPNGSANMVDYATGVPIYRDEPDAQAKEQVKLALSAPELSRVNFSALEFLTNEAEFEHVDLMVEIGKCYNKAKNSITENNSVDDKIPSMVIFGIGLGYHLSELQKATDAAYISVFEPNEDYFYASLFCFEWAEYLQEIDEQGSFLYIGIGDSEDVCFQTLYDRAKAIGAYSITNSFFYQHYPSAAVSKLIDNIRNNFAQFFMGWGFFDDALMSCAHNYNLTQKHIGKINLGHKLPNNVADYPIFIVANGPSLDDDIEQIKALKDDVIVVACNSASTALLKHGIRPDFHVALERGKETYDFLKAFIPEKDRQEINLLIPNVMYPEVVELFGWTGMGLKGGEAGTTHFQLAEYSKQKFVTPTLGYSNPLVGNLALSFFAHMGFKQLYLFGMDSGYISADHHHSKSSFYYDKAGNEKFESYKMGEEYEIEGNFVDKVITEPFLYTGKCQIERLLHSLKDNNISCYNCSNGVKINYTIPLASDNILLGQQNMIKLQVVEHIKFESFSTMDTELNLDDFLDFEPFENICKTMVDILSDEINNRGDARDVLFKQLRYLKSFTQTPRYSHLYLLLEGEALYINCVLLSILYNFGEKNQSLEIFKEALAIWIDFLNRAPQIYRERWNENSAHKLTINIDD